MKLYLIRSLIGEEELITDSPSENQISHLINSIDWGKFKTIRLRKDDNNWIEVSGSLVEDGLAIIYEEDGISFVTKDAPETLTQLEQALLSYFRGDGKYKDQEFVNLGYTEPTPSPPEFQSWKIDFDLKRKADNRERISRFLVALFVIAITGILFFLWYNDELRFLGRETDYTIATVVETKKIAVKGGYILLVKYEFEYDKLKHSGSFKAGKPIGKYYVGDRLKVKFVTKSPNVSKRVARLKRENEL
jgi:hypothetical protein